MATSPAIRPEGRSFLLELLHYAGWRLQVRHGETVRIHAVRDGVEVDVAGASLPEAAGIAFARAMRSGRRRAREG
jgi:hypothetical protein